MADISGVINQIRNAVYGEEVRESLIDGLTAINNDNESYQDIKDQIRADKNAVDSKVDEFADLVEDVTEARDTIVASLAAVETAKQQLATAVTNANTAKGQLQTVINSAEGVYAQLGTQITAANTAAGNAQDVLDDLDASISSATTLNTNLTTAISNAGTAKGQLETAIANAGTVKGNLETEISNANTAKGQLQTVITNAGTAQTALSGVLADATAMNTTLSATLQSATAMNTSLGDKVDTATTKINQLDDRLEDADEILTGVEDLKAYLGYTDEDIVGLQVDFANKTFARLAGAYGKTAGSAFDVFPMYGGRRRCNVADDGTINAYYGDADYEDDGTNGQVMVYQPAFWYKVVPLIMERNTTGIGYHIRKANYYVSSRPKVGFKRHPLFYDAQGNAVDYVLLSAYEGSFYDVSASAYVNDESGTDGSIETGDLLCSVSGQKPISGKTKNMNKVNFETIAANRGAGWHLDTVKSVMANQLLMMIELGTLNTQTAIARGCVDISVSGSNCSCITGSSSTLGNNTGVASATVCDHSGTQDTYTTNGKTAVSYRGQENPWGNIWKHINGINIWGDSHMGGGQVYIADGFTYNENSHTDPYQATGISLANGSGWISAFGYGSEDYDWVLMPSEKNGNSSLPVGDYIYTSSNLSGYRIAFLGGGWSTGDNAGGFYWYCSYYPGNRYGDVGGRLLYVPTATL